MFDRSKTEVADDGVAPEPTPSEQALGVVDRAVGVVPIVAEAVRSTFDRIGEPVTRERVEPVYRDRVEPTVRRVRERI